MTAEWGSPRSRAVGVYGWEDENVTFDLSGLTPGQADAVIYQWAMSLLLRRVRNQAGFSSWAAFIAASGADRNQLYPFLSGSRLGRIEVIAAFARHYPPEHFPSHEELRRKMAGARRRAERHAERQAAGEG